MQFRSFALIILTQLTLIVFLGGCSSSEEVQADYVNRAQEHYDAGDLKKARIEIKNVFQINPNNPQARFLLALIHAEDANWREVAKNLTRAVEYAPNFVDARIKLGGLYYRTFRPDELILEQADEVLAIDPGNADAHALRAVVFRRQGEETNAIKEAQLALDNVPGHVGASSSLAAIYTDQDPELALKYIDNSIEMNPSDSIPKEVKLALLSKQEKTDGVIAVYRELIADSPDDIGYYSRLTQYLRLNGRNDEADALLRALATSPRDSLEFKIWIAQALSRDTLHDMAETTIKGFIVDHPEEYQLRFALATLYLVSQRPADADAIYREVIALDVDGADAQTARGNIAYLAWVSDKDRAVSETMVQEILTIEEGNALALQLRASFKLLDGDNVGATSDLRLALKSDPTSIGTTLVLGDAYSVSGSLDLALDAYRTVLELSPNNAVGVEKISALLIKQGDYTAADPILTSYLEQAPKDVNALILLIESYTLQERWDDALASAAIITGLEQHVAQGTYLKGRVLFAQKEYPAAIAAFEEVLQLEPNAVEALSYLVNTMLLTGEVVLAQEYLSKHIQAYPLQDHALELQGSVYLRSGNFDAAIESFRAALAISPQRLSAQVEIGKALQAQGNMVGALKAYDDALELEPDNIGLLNLKAGLLEAMKRYQDAVDMYNLVLAIDGDQIIASNNLAMLLADHFPSDENYSRALQLTTEFEDTNIAVLLDTRGWIHYKMQDYASAKRLLKRAVAADGDQSVFRFHLGMTYYKLGDKKSAKVELENALANQKTFVGSDEASKLIKIL